ncbi:MAG: hypothetical protein HY521_01510 [Proteobacteria bacterium]|nr:hypothetical protein [Pseudomonadota bacterium]
MLAGGRAGFVRWNVHPTLDQQAALVQSLGARTVVPAFAGREHVEAWRRAFAPAKVSLAREIPL